MGSEDFWREGLEEEEEESLFRAWVWAWTAEFVREVGGVLEEEGKREKENKAP